LENRLEKENSIAQKMKDNSDKIIAEKILQFITSLNDKKVLEIGCGNGRITSFLANKTKIQYLKKDLKNQSYHNRKQVALKKMP